MLISSFASAMKRHGLLAVLITIVGCIGLYVNLGSLEVFHVCLLAGVSFLAILVVGFPLEYHKRSR
jgi:hypothetical protein